MPRGIDAGAAEDLRDAGQCYFLFQAEDGIRDHCVTGVQTCALPISAFSPDALTGMEASLRFGGPETLETKIFGRLSAWQNWIFQRPNAEIGRASCRERG